jgi:uncharacterized membrane protein
MRTLRAVSNALKAPLSALAEHSGCAGEFDMRRTGLALDKFKRDERGAFAIIAALSMPVAVSAVVLGAEVGLYAFRHQAMRGAADAAALSGVISAATGTTLVTQGRAVAASQGYVHGVSNVTIGAVYLPKGDLTYAGGSSGGAGCTQNHRQHRHVYGHVQSVAVVCRNEHQPGGQPDRGAGGVTS